MRIPLRLYHINIGTIRVETSYLDILTRLLDSWPWFGPQSFASLLGFVFIVHSLFIYCSFIHYIHYLFRWKTPSATVATCGNLWQPVAPDPRQRITTHLALQSPCSGSVSCICAYGTRLAQQLCRNQDGAGRAN